MQELKVPQLPEVLGNNVMLPNDVWKTLVEYLNTTRAAVNAQANSIEFLTSEILKLRKDVRTLAEILGGMYDVQE